MSLILEALRKSEAERRRGQSPGLHAELPPVPARRMPAAVAWWVAGIALLLLAFTAWWVSRENPAPPRSTASQVQGVVPAASDEPPPSSQLLPARTSSTATRTAAPVPARSPETSAPGTAPETASNAGPTATRPSTPAIPDAPAARREAPAPATRTTTPVAPAVGDSRPLALAELDPGTRRALPPLKLSMHLWNPDPAQRFVILDGQRLGEGDRAGDASIVRIERDGVLLEWNGRGIRVPVH